MRTFFTNIHKVILPEAGTIILKRLSEIERTILDPATLKISKFTGLGTVGDRMPRDYRQTFLHLIPRQRRASTGDLYIGWAGSYQRIYELFPAVRTLLGTILGLRLARSARVITRGKLSTDTAAGRSTCRSFRSVNGSKTGLGTRATRNEDTVEKERNHVSGCLYEKDDKETGESLCQPVARSLLRSRQWIQPQSAH